MFFEWDQGKAERNLRKHKVPFSEATTVFDDDLGISISNPDHLECRILTVF
jgi:uncharacterized protein